MKQYFEWIKATPDNLPKEDRYNYHVKQRGFNGSVYNSCCLWIKPYWRNIHHERLKDQTEILEYLSPASPLPISGDEERLMEIANAQSKYIGFLSKEIARTAYYLHIHGQGPSDEVVAEGLELRHKIENLQSTVKETI